MNEQTWNAESYAKNGAFVPALGAGVVEWLAPKSGERILDLGCGDGTLTRTLVDSGAIVVGIDASQDLVTAARAKSIDALLGNAHELTFESEFDAVFSNAALHWMLEPDRVIAGVARALKPHGRFVAEFGGAGNIAAISDAVHSVFRDRGLDAESRNPWYFPSAQAYGEKLIAGGFEVERIELFARPTPLPNGMRGWLETFCRPFFHGMPPAEASSLTDEITERLEPVLRDASGEWIADYVRLRFAARKST